MKNKRNQTYKNAKRTNSGSSKSLARLESQINRVKNNVIEVGQDNKSLKKDLEKLIKIMSEMTNSIKATQKAAEDLDEKVLPLKALIAFYRDELDKYVTEEIKRIERGRGR